VWDQLSRFDIERLKRDWAPVAPRFCLDMPRAEGTWRPTKLRSTPLNRPINVFCPEIQVGRRRCVVRSRVAVASRTEAGGGLPAHRPPKIPRYLRTTSHSVHQRRRVWFAKPDAHRRVAGMTYAVHGSFALDRGGRGKTVRTVFEHAQCVTAQKRAGPTTRPSSTGRTKGL